MCFLDPKNICVIKVNRKHFEIFLIYVVEQTMFSYELYWDLYFYLKDCITALIFMCLLKIDSFSESAFNVKFSHFQGVDL